MKRISNVRQTLFGTRKSLSEEHRIEYNYKRIELQRESNNRNRIIK